MSKDDFFNELPIEIVVGYAQKKIRELQNLSIGDIFYLDKLAGEPQEIYVNKKLFALGEAVEIFPDNFMGIRIISLTDNQATDSDKTKESQKVSLKNEKATESIIVEKKIPIIPVDNEIEEVLDSISQKLNSETECITNEDNENNIPTNQEVDKILDKILYETNSRKIRIFDFKKELYFSKNTIKQIKILFCIFVSKISKLYKNTLFTLNSMKEEDYRRFDNYDYLQLFDDYVMFDQRNCGDDYITLCASQSLLDLFHIKNHDMQEFQNIISNPILLEIEKYLKEITNSKNFSITPLYVTNDYHNLRKDIYTKIEMEIKVKVEKENKPEGYIKVLLPSRLLYFKYIVKKKITPKKFQNIYNIPINIYVRLGSASHSIDDINNADVGTVIILDKNVYESIDIIANGIIIAKGRIIVRDEYFAVEVTEIL